MENVNASLIVKQVFTSIESNQPELAIRAVGDLPDKKLRQKIWESRKPHSSNRGDTPLHIAARNGHISVLRTAHEDGATFTCLNDHRKQPLHEAAQTGQANCAAFLLDTVKVPVDCLKRADWTAMMLACVGPSHHSDTVEGCESSYVDCVRLLLEHGADPTFTNKDGWNCLQVWLPLDVLGGFGSFSYFLFIYSNFVSRDLKVFNFTLTMVEYISMRTNPPTDVFIWNIDLSVIRVNYISGPLPQNMIGPPKCCSDRCKSFDRRSEFHVYNAVTGVQSRQTLHPHVAQWEHMNDKSHQSWALRVANKRVGNMGVCAVRLYVKQIYQTFTVVMYEVHARMHGIV